VSRKIWVDRAGTQKLPSDPRSEKKRSIDIRSRLSGSAGGKRLKKTRPAGARCRRPKGKTSSTKRALERGGKKGEELITKKRTTLSINSAAVSHTSSKAPVGNPERVSAESGGGGKTEEKRETAARI